MKEAEDLAKILMRFKKIGFQKNSKMMMRPSEYIVLNTIVSYSLDNPKGIRISDLSSKMQITPAAVTHMMESLVNKEFVERSGDPSDRRIVLIKPTKTGIETVRSMELRFVKKCEDIINYLGPKDSKEFIRLVTLTINYLADEK
jgi:DNA-binding MarR family transcriptional regulator